MLTKEVFEKIQAEQRAKNLQKQQFRHNWRVTIFSTIAGGVAGFLTSLAFWLITK